MEGTGIVLCMPTDGQDTVTMWLWHITGVIIITGITGYQETPGGNSRLKILV